MHHLTDEEIIVLIQQGDTNAYQILFDRYYEILCLKALRYTNNPTLSEDIVQQVFIQFWEQKRYNAIQTSLFAYLNAMVRNSAINAIRKESRGNEKYKMYTQIKETAEIKNPVELAELAREMNKAIEELPPQCRALFKAVYLEGKKYSEAAREAGLSVNTVKEQLRRAFRKMREKLKNMRYVFFIL